MRTGTRTRRGTRRGGREGFILVVLGLVLSVAATGSAAEIFVGPDAATISEGLAMARPGDTIIVLSGYDSETAGEPFPIWIGVAGVTIRCQEGARIAVPPSNAGFVIQADGVTIENCEITSEASADPTDSDSLGDIGILVAPGAGAFMLDRCGPSSSTASTSTSTSCLLPEVADVTLQDNRISNLLQGIRLIHTTRSVIRGNALYDIGAVRDGKRWGIAIHLEASTDNDLIDNEAYDSGVGLFLIGSGMNRVSGDRYHDNASGGVHLEKSYENTFDGLSVQDNGGEGFALLGSDRNALANSDLSRNKRAGVKLMGSDDNVIKGNNIHDNGDGQDEDINVLLTGGTMVRFTAPKLVPDGETFQEIEAEKAYMEGRVDDLQIAVEDLDAELEEVVQKIDTARGMIAQAQVRVSPLSIIFVADGSGSMKGAIPDVQEAVRESLELLTPGRDEAGIIEFGYGQGGGIKPGQNTGKLDPADPALQEAIDRFSADGNTALYDAIGEAINILGQNKLGQDCYQAPPLPPDPPDERIWAVLALTDGRNNRGTLDYQPVIEAAQACGIRVYTIGLGDNIDEPVLKEIARETGGHYEHAPTPQDLADKFAGMVGVIGTARIEDKVKEAIDELYCILDGTTPYDQVTCPYPAGKLAFIEGIKGDIRDEAEAIKAKLDRLVDEGVLTPALGDELKQKLEAVIGALLAADDILDTIGGLIELVIGQAPLDPAPAPDSFLEGALSDLELGNLAGADSHLGEARFILRQVMAMKEEIFAAIEEIREKLALFNEELPIVSLLGEELVGKADGFAITQAQINALRAELVTRLNGDPQIAGLLALADVRYERVELGGSTGNILASNVITSDVLSEGPNIGIVLEAGSEGNTLVNNLITNEDLERGLRGRFGNLNVGIQLLTSGNRILFNAVEFVNTAMIRGGPQEREGVKHLYLFKKLAHARCQALDLDLDPDDCRAPLAKAIVGELREERIDVVIGSAHVEQNRISLNFFEENGIGIDVIDAESNTIDGNLFLNNTNDAIRLAVGAVVDIETRKNDFQGNGAAVSNNDPETAINVSNNYFGNESGPFHETRNPTGTGDQVIGRAEVSPWATTPFCGGNFEGDGKFEALGIVEFFWGGLPPNLGFLPEKVSLPTEKPRLCSDIFGNGTGDSDAGTGGLPTFPSKTSPPHDLNGDGLFEDVNGNGRLDFDDSVTLALYIDWVAPEDQSAFDFNGNGRLDFDDAVRLAFKVGGEAAVQALLEMFGRTELSVTNIATAFDGDGSGVRFVVEGQGIAEIRVEVYDLAGALVYDGGFVAGNQLRWNLLSDDGDTVANGVYLTVVTVKGVGGALLRSEVRRLLLLR